jgi:mevalonyl-CoA ligase
VRDYKHVVRSLAYTAPSHLNLRPATFRLSRKLLHNFLADIMAELYDQSIQPSPLHRLNQTLLQIDPYILPPYPNLSLVAGRLDPPLLDITLSQLLLQQSNTFPHNECLIIPWTGCRWTYKDLWDASNSLARALLKNGVKPRDRVGIMAGNCEQYVAVFFACARIGAMCVTLNNTYTVMEMENALRVTRKYFVLKPCTATTSLSFELISRC